MKPHHLLAGLLALVCSAADLHKPAPDFTLKDSTGASVSLSSYKGKVVLLDFWATWCGGCKVEIPWFMEFQTKYKDRGLAVVGVSMDEDGWKVVKPFMAAKKINYQILLGDDKLTQPYGLEALPVTFLIDRQGKVVSSHEGLGDKANFEREIQALLH